jgi:RNA 2',3'-cyclic 3'-phosphodiesterase
VRLFVAIDPPDSLRDAIERDVVEPLRAVLTGARWTRPGGRHLTLKFLGNVDDERFDEIAGALGDVAPKHRPFEASFEEVGGFPTLRHLRVLWIGIGEGAEPMSRLAADIETAYERLGFESEHRPFRAHFTLARFPRPLVVEDLPHMELPTDPFVVREVVLFRSQLHPKGARYTAVERFLLKGFNA